MIIDLTGLIVRNDLEIVIDDDIDISSEYLKNTSIKGLDKVHFTGSINSLSDGDFEISGKIFGKMTLADDVTLEDVQEEFHIEVEEVFNDMVNDNKLQIVQNKLDITDFLWQNILVEVPSKIRKDDSNIHLEGDGWRFITEDELVNDNKSPFSELSKILDSGKE